MRRITAAIIIGCGVLLGAHALWIPAKAELAQILLARAWNRALEGRASRPWPGADMRPVALLEIDGRRLIVLDGSSPRTLAFGPGHIPSSASPGAPGVCVIAGHRDTSFRTLNERRPGELVRMISLSGDLLTYRITNIARLPHPQLSAVSDGELLVLVTCVPGSRESRLVLTAERVPAVRSLLLKSAEATDERERQAHPVAGRGRS